MGETSNIATAQPQLVRRLLALMDEAHRPSPQYPLFHNERKGK